MKKVHYNVMMMMMVVWLLKQTHDMHSVWRGIARPNSFEVTSEAAVRHGVDSSFSFDVHIQQSDLESLVFHISQDLHEVGRRVMSDVYSCAVPQARVEPQGHRLSAKLKAPKTRYRKMAATEVYKQKSGVIG